MVLSSNELDMLILQNGEQGTPGNSKYIWVKYSQNANGTPLTDDPNGAVYIGIAYNKDEALESDNPLDYDWTRILGNDGNDAYTIILSNENISFASKYEDNTIVGDQSYICSVHVYQGVKERTDFEIDEIDSSNGITVSVSEKDITFQVIDGTKISEDYGTYTIPIIIDGNTINKSVSWSLSKQGPQGNQGNPGQPSINIVIGNESQNIPCSNNGRCLENFLIEIPFAGYSGINRVPCSVVVGVLPRGITLGSNQSATSEADGLIVLNVAKDADLGGDNVLSGKIALTFSIENVEMSRFFYWNKTKDGAQGEHGSMVLYTLEVSSPIVNKMIDGSLDPEKVDFFAYTRSSNEVDYSPYSGRFIISESKNGTTFSTKYTSSKDETQVSYIPSSSNIKSIRCVLCISNSVTDEVDSVTVPILSGAEELKPIIQEIQTSISGVESEVDAVNKQITDKVWQSDVTTAINNYDNTTVKTIRDQVAEHTTEIGQISSTVSDVESTLETKADGSTVQSLSEKVSSMEQDAEGFKQTVSETYATKDELENTSETLTSTIEQTAGEINQTVSDLSGNVSTNTQNISSITQRITNAEGDITSLEQTASGVQTEITNARGDSATLSGRFDKISSEIETIDGEVSEVQQTANEIKTEVATKQPYLITSIRYIRDWLNGSSKNTGNHYVECRVMVGEENIAEGITAVAKNENLQNISPQPSNINVYTDNEIITYDDQGSVNASSYVSCGSGKVCLQLDLGTLRSDIDYIQTVHYYLDDRIYNHKLEVSEDGITWVTLYDSDISGGYQETQDGRIYNISDGYINNKYSQISQTVNGISSIVETNSDSISRLEQTSNSFTSQIQQIQSNVENVNNNIQDINNEIALNQSTIEQTFNEIRSTISGMSSDMEGIAQSIVEQSSEEWKALFSQIGMGNYPNKNTNVIMSVNGLTVRNPDTGVETVMSPEQFVGRYLGNTVFQLNKDLTITRRIQVDNGADFTTLKYINKTYTSKSNKSIGALVHIKSGGSS